MVDAETGEIDPALVRIVCTRCGAEHRVQCRTGNVKGWVNKFASVHMHLDPMSPKRVTEQAAALTEQRAKKLG